MPINAYSDGTLKTGTENVTRTKGGGELCWTFHTAPEMGLGPGMGPGQMAFHAFLHFT